MVLSKLTTLLGFAAIAVSLADATDLRPRIHPNVHRKLRTQESINLIVTLRADPSPIVNAVKESDEFATRGQKIASLVESLEINAKESQQEISSMLAQEADATLFTNSKSFWISNQVWIENAKLELVEKLVTLSSIAEVYEEEVFQLQPVETLVGVSSNNTLTAEWGVEKIQATEVWASGNTGQGVVVATIDSGARGSHEALENNFRRAYGWYDPEAQRAVPYDNNGHGTHTIGTIVGANGVGVAPGATWISCKGCRSSSCPQSDLLACGEFITCPTDTAGRNKDCSKAPDLVSNSWGGGQGRTSYKAVVDAWQAAGIIPIFANGNSGPNCNTANSPGDLPNVIAVGATDVNDALASFSSKGPARSRIIKPEISGPGVAVRSTWNTGDSNYNSISGTSMATPHVAGVIALLLKEKPTLTYQEALNAITTTTDRTLAATGRTCGGTADATYPNNQYGFGRINALKAVNKVKRF